MVRVGSIATRWAVILAFFIVCDVAIYAYTWGQRGAPTLHIHWLIPAAIACALASFVTEKLLNRHKDAGWAARLFIPRWSAFGPFFKGSRLLFPMVVLSYVLFYVTQGLAAQSPWAEWVNESILNFYLFCRRFTAIDVIRIEIGGYALYLALYGLYIYYCPQIAARVVRKEGGLAREDASLVLADTIERHGAYIPSGDLAASVADFAGECRGYFDEDRKTLLDHRLGKLAETSGEQRSSSVARAVAADAAGVARLFPSQLGTESYYLGRDLFDILYPVVRACLCAGLSIALLATSLPVAAKLLWVAFPRFGERCMVDIMQVPPHFRDADWIEFEGTEDYRDLKEVILIPEEDAGERWHLSPEDAIQIDTSGMKRIFLRKGGKISDIKRTTGIGTSLPAAGVAARMSQQCGINGSRCSNHLEICCGSNEIVGRCYGRWSCPRP